MSKVVVYTDGAARGNPGPASIAYVIDIEKSQPIEHAETIGSTTNNQAEYEALRQAVAALEGLGIRNSTISCFSDSELMVKQLNGQYKLKNQEIRAAAARIRAVVAIMESRGNTISFQAVPRNLNKRADQLANLALDGKF